MRPSLGLSRPAMRLSNVVLPEPLGPIRPRNSPSGTSKLSPLSTSMRSLPRSKYLCKFSTRTIASAIAILPFAPCGFGARRLLLRLQEINDHPHVRPEVDALFLLGHLDLDAHRDGPLAAVGRRHHPRHLALVPVGVDLAERLEVLVRFRHDRTLLADDHVGDVALLNL